MSPPSQSARVVATTPVFDTFLFLHGFTKLGLWNPSTVFRGSHDRLSSGSSLPLMRIDEGRARAAAVPPGDCTGAGGT